MPGTVVWFSRDLRLSDHAALSFAADADGPVVPLFVWAPEEHGGWAPGGAHRWWLGESLAALDADLRSRGSRLTLRTGPSLAAIRDVLAATGAERVVWHSHVAPELRERDARVREALQDDGVEVRLFAGRILHDPTAIQTGSGGPYHVYGPFWRKLQAQMDVGEPLATPRLGETRAPAAWPESETLDSFDLSAIEQDGVDWAGGMRDFWTPGEAGAHARLERFLDLAVDYDDDRNRPDLRHTSELSPHLHWGEVSPRQVWTSTNRWVSNGPTREAADKFLSELAWREFSYHLLFHYPGTTDRPLKEKFAPFEWDDDEGAFRAWRRGQTGYPIVDAGMRQLWALGWMHNRVRMITGSFLTKDLLISWVRGARYFWDTLCGGDLANNTMGWQWVAGSGADAQPFFRIFNPVSQAERYDPAGDFVREWVPELAGLPAKWIHKPWEAPDGVLADAGVTLGETYPRPIVDHGERRDEALARYQKIR